MLLPFIGTGFWNLQIEWVDDSLYRDAVYVILGLLLLYATDTIYTNALLSPMNWGGSSSGTVIDAGSALGPDPSLKECLEPETELLRTRTQIGSLSSFSTIAATSRTASMSAEYEPLSESRLSSVACDYSDAHSKLVCD